jgi:hypothetical protein
MKEHSIQQLRFELIEMLRISQRAVDYAAKACESGRSDYAQHASFGSDRLNYISRKIAITTSELRATQQLKGTKLAFSESARTISMALLSTCQHAYGVCSHAAELSSRDVYKPSKYLVTTSTFANSATRLCVVALIKKEVEHAEQALREIDMWRRNTSHSSWPRGASVQPMLSETISEQSIARSLLKIMANMRTIALASTTLLAVDV